MGQLKMAGAGTTLAQQTVSLRWKRYCVWPDTHSRPGFRVLGRCCPNISTCQVPNHTSPKKNVKTTSKMCFGSHASTFRGQNGHSKWCQTTLSCGACTHLTPWLTHSHTSLGVGATLCVQNLSHTKPNSHQLTVEAKARAHARMRRPAHPCARACDRIASHGRRVRPTEEGRGWHGRSLDGRMACAHECACMCKHIHHYEQTQPRSGV